jgi:hypothetical protein
LSRYPGGRAERLDDELVVVERGQDQRQWRGAAGQRAEHTDAVQNRHPQVEQQHVDPAGADGLERLTPVPGLGRHRELVSDLQLDLPTAAAAVHALHAWCIELADRPRPPPRHRQHRALRDGDRHPTRLDHHGGCQPGC